MTVAQLLQEMICLFASFSVKKFDFDHFIETAATIFSKNFNYGRSNYLPNEHCNWTIQTETEDEHIVLLFSDYFSLESGSRCARFGR